MVPRGPTENSSHNVHNRNTEESIAPVLTTGSRNMSPRNDNAPQRRGVADQASGDLLLLFVAVHRLDAEQLDVEHQHRVGGDRRARALLAIGQLAGDVELVLLAHVHQL